jgi:DNA-binding transcriptional LysR family regulator
MSYQQFKINTDHALDIMMGMMDDTTIFAAVIQQGSFSRAATFLGLSNGMVSRRIAQLEASLGVSLIKRTTRQLHLTREGEIFWRHAERIQQEFASALRLIQTSAEKPKGKLPISAPAYFGRHYLTPMITKFLLDFDEIQIDLLLTNQQVDLIQDNLDLVIRGSGYFNQSLQDSSLKMKLLLKEKICLYASPDYLLRQGEPQHPEMLSQHRIIGFANKTAFNAQQWVFSWQKNTDRVVVTPTWHCNDIDSCLAACIDGYGIGRFTELNAMQALASQQLRPILQEYDWGDYHLFAIYSNQQALPARTRLLLDFIAARMQNMHPSV